MNREAFLSQVTSITFLIYRLSFHIIQTNDFSNYSDVKMSIRSLPGKPKELKIQKITLKMFYPITQTKLKIQSSHILYQKIHSKLLLNSLRITKLNYILSSKILYYGTFLQK